MRLAARFLFGLALLWGAEEALAHARLKPVAGGLTPRNNNAGLKVGPCGGIARTATPAVFTPGQTITVDWEETIQHPGRFEFSFSPANDAGFMLLKTVQDNQDNNVLPHSYTTTLTLPTTPCDACTIQMIQVMTENPNNPSFYYSCADIKIQAAVPPPAPAPTPGPTPAPSPTPPPGNCD